MNKDELYHNGLTKNVYNRINVASFTENATTTDPTGNSFKTTIDGVGDGSTQTTQFQKKISSKQYKRYGLNSLFVSGYVYQTSSGDPIFTSTTWYVRISMGGLSKTLTLGSTGNFTGKLDISSLPEGEYYPAIEMKLEGTTDNSGGSNVGSITLHLREDVDFMMGT